MTTTENLQQTTDTRDQYLNAWQIVQSGIKDGLRPPRGLTAWGDGGLTLMFNDLAEGRAWVRALGLELRNDTERRAAESGREAITYYAGAYAGAAVALFIHEPAEQIGVPLEEPDRTLTSVEQEAEARATEGGRTPYDATVEDAAPLPATLGCPRCPHTEYASEEDPDAGLSAMHNHIFSYHADRDPEATIALLAKVTAEVFAP